MVILMKIKYSTQEKNVRFSNLIVLEKFGFVFQIMS